LIELFKKDLDSFLMFTDRAEPNST